MFLSSNSFPINNTSVLFYKVHALIHAQYSYNPPAPFIAACPAPRASAATPESLSCLSAIEVCYEESASGQDQGKWDRTMWKEQGTERMREESGMEKGETLN
jgi:hypothetical protein